MKKYKKQTAIRDKMLQLSKLQLQKLNNDEHAFEKLPQDMKDFANHLESFVEQDEAFEKLVHAADYNRADLMISHLSEKRGRLN